MRYYLVDGERFTDIDKVLDYCISGEYHDRYDDGFEEWINDNYSGADIGGYQYSAYDILDRFDDLHQFEEDYKDCMDESDADDARYELNHADNGDHVYCQGYTIEVVDEEEDEETIADYVDRAREYYDKLQEENKKTEAEELEVEKDVMDIFQVI